MTNTRITDVEILEKRYAILLNQFSLRKNSGGKGKTTGGNGVIREFCFRKEQEISLLTERRVNQVRQIISLVTKARRLSI